MIKPPKTTNEPPADFGDIALPVCSHHRLACEDCITELADLKARPAQPPAWVRTDERLPENREEVLVYNHYGQMIQRSYEEFTDQNAAWFKQSFTHWRPLPIPPFDRPDAEQRDEILDAMEDENVRS